MEVTEFALKNGAAVIEHTLGTRELAVWVRHTDGKLLAPYFAQALDDRRVEVMPVPGIPVEAFVVEANLGDGSAPRPKTAP